MTNVLFAALPARMISASVVESDVYAKEVKSHRVLHKLSKPNDNKSMTASEGDESPQYGEEDRKIRDLIAVEERHLLNVYPWLNNKYKDVIAASFMGISISTQIVCFILHFNNRIGWCPALVLSTLALSTLHEIEHDLFHNMFFGTPKDYMHRVAMTALHVFKLHVSPWWRRKFHLQHHAHSGHALDIEERLIGLGMPIGFKKLLVTMSPLCYIFACPDVMKDNPKFVWYEPLMESKLQAVFGGLPFFWLFSYFGFVTLPDLFDQLLFSAFICTSLASHVRHVCITVSTTCVHYYGNIEHGVVHEQVQVFEPMWLTPFQIGCWYFGSSHWVHHFVVMQPFWIRSMIAFRMNAKLRSGDIIDAKKLRFNDHSGLLKSNSR